MDIYFTYSSVTDIPYYNCSILTEDEIIASRSIRRPVRGITAFLVGLLIVTIYVLCMQVMLRPKMFSKACYKIMFFIGVYEIVTISIHDFIIAYSLSFGLDFCDKPNLFFFFGCCYSGSWAGASFLCLYLAFNRMIEILRYKRSTIDFFFSAPRTYFGCFISFIYSFSFFLCNTPVVYSNLVGTTIPDPLGLLGKIDFEYRNNLMMINNFGVVVITFLLYSYFCLLSYKNIRRLPEITSQHIRLQHQVFIQATLICGVNFAFSITYAIYVVFPQLTALPEIVFVAYQYSIGIQAFIYLFFNQTIRDGVKENLFGVLNIKIHSDSTAEMRTAKINVPSSNELAVSAIHSSGLSNH